MKLKGKTKEQLRKCLKRLNPKSVKAGYIKNKLKKV